MPSSPIFRGALLVAVLAITMVATAVPAPAQCLPPDKPVAVTWTASGSTLHLVWATGFAFGPPPRTVSGWTVELRPPGGMPLTFDVDSARPATDLAVAPAVYDVSISGRNVCGSGLPSTPLRVDMTAPAPSPAIVINEIGPFIELLNTGPATLNLADWRLYASSGLDQQVTQGPRIDDLTFVQPGCSLLLGDTTLEAGVPVDFRVPGNFGFGTSLGLARPDGRLIDQVGRSAAGEASVVPPYGEGTLLPPLTTVPLNEMRSYSRVGPDTGDNQRDFALTLPPTPRNSGACRGIPVAPFGAVADVIVNSVLISWQFEDGGVPIDGFQLEAGSRPGAADIAAFRVGREVRSIRFEGVPAGVYYVRVRSFAGAQFSGASNELQVVVCGAASCGVPPGAPRDFRATITGVDVTLTWQAPGSGGAPTSYVLEVGSVQGAADILVVDLGSTATSLFVPNVPRGITFFARVRARNATGLGPPSNEFVVRVP